MCVYNEKGNGDVIVCVCVCVRCCIEYSRHETMQIQEPLLYHIAKTSKHKLKRVFYMSTLGKRFKHPSTETIKKKNEQKREKRNKFECFEQEESTRTPLLPKLIYHFEHSSINFIRAGSSRLFLSIVSLLFSCPFTVKKK